MIGLSISTIEIKKIDLLFLRNLFLVKFLFWPAVMLLLIYLDKSYISFYSNNTHRVLLVMSMVPLAANLVSWTNILKLEASQTAFAVLASTAFSLIYIPIALLIFNF